MKKVYVLLNQKQHSDTIYFEDQKGRETNVTKTKTLKLTVNLLEKALRKQPERFIKIFFTRKDAIMHILDPSVNDAILKSFNDAKAKGLAKDYQLKAFFFIKASNIILNTKKRLYSCLVNDAENIHVHNGITYASELEGIKEERISAAQMKSSMTVAIPGLQKIINDILGLPDDIVENLPKASKMIASSLKYGLKEMAIKMIDDVDVLIQAVTIAEELRTNESKNNIN